MMRSKTRKIIGGLVLLLVLAIAPLQVNALLCCWELANCKGPTCCLLSGYVDGCVITCISGVKIYCVPRADIEPGIVPDPQPAN